MMQKLRPVLLVAICAVLAVLVWLDAAPDDTPQREARRPSAEISSATATGADESDTALASPETLPDQPETQPIEAAPNQTERAQGNVTEETDTGAASVDESSIANPLSSMGVEQLDETVDRPLFAPTRKRPPPKEAGAPASQQDDHSYDLLGVSLGGSRPIAIMRKKADGKSFRVEAGDTLGVWHVTKVDAREVHLERNGGELEVIRLLRK